MGWKKLPYWLRGGFIGLLFYVVLISICIIWMVYLYSTTNIQDNPEKGLAPRLIMMIPGIILLDTLDMMINITSLKLVIVFSSTTIFYFLIGIFISFIIGKFKGGKK